MRGVDDPASFGPQAPRAFISYRRTESSGQAGRLYDRLVARLGTENVFMDIDSIWGGADFAKTVEDAIWKCDALVALIGPSWLKVGDAKGKRRLDDPDDLVRLEIEAALLRGIRVIPVLVEGAQMPDADELPASLRELAHRHALELSHGRFDADVESLVRVLERAKAENQRDEWDGAPPNQRQSRSDISPSPGTSIHDAQGKAGGSHVPSRAAAGWAGERDFEDIDSPPAASASATERVGRSRRRGMLLTVLIGFLFGAGTASGYFLLTREQPSEIYDRLVLEHLTEEERCSQTQATSPDPRGNLAADGVLAEALCVPADPNSVKARYYLIHSTLGMQTAFYDILLAHNVDYTNAVADKLAAIQKNAGLTLPDLKGEIDAQCRNLEGTANVWIANPEAGSAAHLEMDPGAATSSASAGTADASASPSPVEQGPTGGLVACYVSGGMHVMAWTDNQTTILTIATGPRRDDLYNWWEVHAGPANELAPGGGM